jgi:hypothetical protein
MSKEDIIKKIQKLLAVSKDKGASENEAMMAADMAQKLLQAHNLSLGEIKNNENVEPINKESFEVERDVWRGWIRNATAKLYYCTTYSSSKLDELYRRVKVTVFVGRESNRIVAKHMSDYFIETVERLADKEFEKVPGNRSEVNRMKHAFKQGCASRLSQRLRDKYAESNKPVEYTGIDNPDNLPLSYKNEEKAVVEWLENQGIKLVSKSTRFSVRDRVAFGRGSEKANDIGLNTQVNANARGYISN